MHPRVGEDWATVSRNAGQLPVLVLVLGLVLAGTAPVPVLSSPFAGVMPHRVGDLALERLLLGVLDLGLELPGARVPTEVWTP